MKKISIGLFILLFTGFSVSGQDIHFSQFTEIPATLNPALAGVSYETRATSNFKNQWGSVGKTYRTIGLTFEQTIKYKKLSNNYFAVMGNIYRDEAGASSLRTLNPNFGMSWITKINRRMKISAGVQTGFFYKTLDASGFQWGEQYNGYTYDPTLPSGEPTTPRSAITAFDIGTGINLNYMKSDRFLTAKDAIRFDAGIAVSHFGIARNSFIVTSERLETKYTGYFNSEFNIPSTNCTLLPSLLYMRQGPNQQIVVGAMFKFILGDPSTYTLNKKPRAPAIGGYYRYQDAIVPSLLFQYNKYALGVAYDINVSALTPASKRNGGLELVLRYNVFTGYGVHLGRPDAKPSY